MKQLYSEGKIIFTSRLHARQIQWQLKQEGFVYETDNQRIRPNAYGVMWRKQWVKGGICNKTMRTAGNERVLKVYGAHKKTSLYYDSTQVINNVPGREKAFENVRKEQAKTNKIVFAIFDYLLGLNIGYDFTAKRTKKGTPIRQATWSAFAHLLNELHPNAKPFQIKRAIRERYKNAPEDRKLKELLKSGRPQGLLIGEIKISV